MLSWGRHYGKQYGVSSKKKKNLKIEIPCDSAIPQWVYIQRKWNYLKEISVLPRSLQHYSQYLRWKQPQCLLMDGWIKCDTCVHCRILFNHKKEGSPAVCLNMDETGGNYAETNKPDRERQIVCGLTFIGNLKNKKMELIGTESWKMMVARDWSSGDEGNKERLIKVRDFCL